MRFQWMAQGFVHIDSITVAPTFTLLGEHIGLFQVFDNAGRCALRDADPNSYVSHPRIRVLSKTHQNMGVVAQKSPRPAIFLLLRHCRKFTATAEISPRFHHFNIGITKAGYY